ncbi:MAG: prepilin peptidase [Chloroflexi bacterium]|nr:prepilin peptidase [Chloroflexota bacterium]
MNQLGSDLPARRKLTRPHCPYCGQARPWWQWLAVPAYLVGRARCPHCDARIRWRHPLVEVGLATAYGYLWIMMEPSIKFPFYLIYAAIFALILVTDMERKLILNVVTFPSIILAIVASFLLPDILPWNALAGGAVGFFTFLLLVVIGKIAFGSGALGEGDITLATFIGLITGFPLIIEALVLTTLSGAIISTILLVTRVRSLRDHIPYGPFLIIGATITLLKGYSIANWFLNR